ncbi:hypothetical protein [Pseudomonas jilinensis]|nr:hypothetical protein [Pseudomonas jilinensis]
MQTAKTPLQIRPKGRMWHIFQGERVVGFARDYQFAKHRAAELERVQTLH